MDTSILEIIERRKAGRRATDDCPLSVYWPTFIAVGFTLLALGFWLGKVT